MSCRVGDLSLSISWFVCEFFSVGEFLSPSCYSVSCLSVSCRVTEGGTYVFMNNLDHMTKMVFMSIYDKNIHKSFPEPVDRFQRNLACSIDD